MKNRTYIIIKHTVIFKILLFLHNPLPNSFFSILFPFSEAHLSYLLPRLDNKILTQGPILTDIPPALIPHFYCKNAVKHSSTSRGLSAPASTNPHWASVPGRRELGALGSRVP